MTTGADFDNAFRIAPGIDRHALARAFDTHGRVRIRGLLADPAPLARNLAERADWRQVINSGDRIYELDRATRREMGEEKRRALDEAVHAGATHGFQFRYESIRVPDDAGARAASADPVHRFAAWMSTGPMRDLLRTVTGSSAIAFADAQATRFTGGDFLTGHDDAVDGKRRHAAYVFGLTPAWRLEWGGALTFHDGADGFSGLVPGFNTLDLFRVPLLHSVSLVSPAAGAARHAITGWLRS